MSDLVKRLMTVDPDDVGLTVNSNGTFMLEFTEYVPVESGPRKAKVVRLTLKDWWVGIIAAELRTVAQKRIDEAKRLMEPFKDAA